MLLLLRRLSQHGLAQLAPALRRPARVPPAMHPAIAVALGPLGVPREQPAAFRRALATAGGGSTRADADAELRRIHVALADAFGEDKATLADGRVQLDLGPSIGYYSISSEVSGRPAVPKILLTSPVSGARWYVWDAPNESWSSPDDGHHLVELFVRELMHSTARYVNL
ncbi:hypothetical protein KFE25_009140 [Diacronema lutheri]|uniref:Frataxin n=1 Tax=Diacronema lutheri TaxID=2081491 RepID=A0A8J5Y4E9_DIALT|nr:hypothetical protein KFE25_009140 [Diacronema lutheri]